MNPKSAPLHASIEGTLPSLQTVQVTFAPTAAAKLQFQEVALPDPTGSPPQFNPELRTWVNVYPDSNLIVLGTAQAYYRTHASVHESLCRLMSRKGMNEAPDENIVSAWVDGNPEGTSQTLSLYIPGPPRSYERMQRLAATLENAIQLAEARAAERGGRVVLQADGESEQKMAKILGRLHQVANIGKTDVEMISDAIDGDQLESEVRHIYDRNTGTRYFFGDDLEKLSNRVVFNRQAYQGADNDSAWDTHRETMLRTFEQLAYYFTKQNRRGNREGQLFIVDRKTGQQITSKDVLSEFEDAIIDSSSSIKYSLGWPSALEEHIRETLGTLINKIKDRGDPDFYAINTQSPRFVELISQLIRSESPEEAPERRFSTPLEPLHFGYVRPNADGGREFVVTTTDPKLQDIGHWLFGKEARTFIADNDCPLAITDADYICVYKPKTLLTFEPHPPDFIRKLGEVSVESFVVEWGSLDSPPFRLILKGNEYAPSRLPERETPTVKELLKKWSAWELSEFIREFKEAQHDLLKCILTVIPDTKVTLANKERWVSVYGPSATDEEKLHKTHNYCAKFWVEGPRADLIDFGKRDDAQQRLIVQMEADVSAALILAGAPYIQSRDLIFDPLSGNNIVTVGTFLSTNELFCHGGGSSVQHYCKQVVPILYGNHMARRAASLDYSLAPDEQVSLRHKQDQLIDAYTKRIRKTLLTFSTGVPDGGTGAKERILLAIREAATTHRAHLKGWRPEMFQPETFVRFTLELLDWQPKQINAICKQIGMTAKKELNLITKIAHIPESGATVETLEQFENCANSVSSLIAAHLLKRDYLEQAITGLKTVAAPNPLTVLERSWYTTVLDVNIRIAEVRKKTTALPMLKILFEKAKDRENFAKLLKESSLKTGLADETIKAFYDAVYGLRAAYRDFQPDPKDRVKALQLEAVLTGLHPLGKLITE